MDICPSVHKTIYAHKQTDGQGALNGHPAGMRRRRKITHVVKYRSLCDRQLILQTVVVSVNIKRNDCVRVDLLVLVTNEHQQQ
jgi:hypothetical protein